MPSPPDHSSKSSLTTSARLSQAVDTIFNEDVVPQAPEDPLFGLMAAYRKDTNDKKVDLGIGAYRDNNAKPWILPVVKKVNMSKMPSVSVADLL